MMYRIRLLRNLIYATTVVQILYIPSAVAVMESRQRGALSTSAVEQLPSSEVAETAAALAEKVALAAERNAEIATAVGDEAIKEAKKYIEPIRKGNSITIEEIILYIAGKSRESAKTARVWAGKIKNKSAMQADAKFTVTSVQRLEIKYIYLAEQASNNAAIYKEELQMILKLGVKGFIIENARKDTINAEKNFKRDPSEVVNQFNLEISRNRLAWLDIMEQKIYREKELSKYLPSLGVVELILQYI